MAEIPIQRKERRNVWPLVLILLVVLIAAWYFWSQRTTSANTASADSARAVAVDTAHVTPPPAAPKP